MYMWISTVLNRRRGKWWMWMKQYGLQCQSCWRPCDPITKCCTSAHWTVLFYFARAKLAARDVAIHNILRRQMIHCDGGDGEKPMPPRGGWISCQKTCVPIHGRRRPPRTPRMTTDRGANRKTGSARPHIIGASAIDRGRCAGRRDPRVTIIIVLLRSRSCH